MDTDPNSHKALLELGLGQIKLDGRDIMMTFIDFYIFLFSK